MFTLGLEQSRAQDLSRPKSQHQAAGNIFGSSPLAAESRRFSESSFAENSASHPNARRSATEFGRNSMQTASLGTHASGSPFSTSYSGSGSSSSSPYSTPGSPGSWPGSCPSSPHHDRFYHRHQDYQQSWRSREADRDLVPRFSGMSLGDLMKVTVMKEMERLNMTKDKALDLSKKG